MATKRPIRGRAHDRVHHPSVTDQPRSLVTSEGNLHHLVPGSRRVRVLPPNKSVAACFTGWNGKRHYNRIGRTAVEGP